MTDHWVDRMRVMFQLEYNRNARRLYATMSFRIFGQSDGVTPKESMGL